jgi:hypothetical protein
MTANRISKVDIKETNGEIVLQYFNRDLQYPDSLKIFSKRWLNEGGLLIILR